MRKLSIAYGNSRTAKTWSNKVITFDDLCEALKNPMRTIESTAEYPKLSKAKRDEIKDRGGFVAGHLKDNRRKKENVVCRSMLVYDLDNITTDFLESIQSKVPNCACYYTTHSHTTDKPRARMIVPLTRDVNVDEFNAVARYYAHDNNFIDMLDPCSFSPHQLMYWPTCSSDGEYISEVIEGEWLNPDDLLTSHPTWTDCSLLPTTTKESIVRELKSQKQKDPAKKDGIVGAVCRAYTISEVIDEYLADIYEPVDNSDDRYTYIPGEGSAGVVVYDDKFAYSHHATDPAGGKLCNAFDLVRLHTFPDLDDKASYSATTDFFSADEKVMVYSQYSRHKKMEYFRNDHLWNGRAKFC